MNSLSGFNSQEIRRLHPYLSALLRRVKALEAGAGKGEAKIEWGTDSDIVPTGNSNSGGVLNKVARADHQHLFKFPVAVPLSTPDGSAFFDLSTSAINIYVGNTPTTKVVAGATTSDVKPTGVADTGTAPRYAFADHSHPTAILPQSNSQSPVADEIRYTGTNRLVRWNGSAWVNFVGALPVPADPLVLPLNTQVSSPQNRQLVNHNNWDNIGNATLFYYDRNFSSFRLAFARPLVVAIASTPSDKDVWSSTANELVLKYHSGNISGAAGVLWSRGGGTTTWSPVLIQLKDSATDTLTNDVGVLARSALTGTSGSRRWFLRGAQEGGSFRAPFVGFASFTASATPAPADLSTALNDGYAYFIYDYDRVDIVRPITDGNKHPSIFSHAIVAPPCHTFNTTADPSGHYVIDEVWNNIWVVAFYTTTSATTDLWARLPTIPVGLGVRAGRVLLYLHNPQSSAISPVFAVAVYVPTSTTPYAYTTSNTTINIPANSTTVADLGFLSFSPSTALSHYRSHLITVNVIRRKGSEATNSNKVILLGVVIVPQRAA